MEAKIAEIRQLAVKADALVDVSVCANTRRPMAPPSG
jgi:hypothetical protein